MIRWFWNLGVKLFWGSLLIGAILLLTIALGITLGVIYLRRTF